MTPFEQLIDQTNRLAVLDNDSPEADALRDEMDATWRALTPAEQECARWYSAGIQKGMELAVPKTTGAVVALIQSVLETFPDPDDREGILRALAWRHPKGLHVS